jgi:5-carboxymethyl-2-hydroxymuconate isomerase
MPHLTLEYTDNLKPATSFGELFSHLHRIVADVGGIPLNNCKSRAIRLEEYFAGEGGARQAFAHLTIRFMAGRSVEVKEEIGRQSLAALRHFFPPVELALQVTLEIQEIERSTYFKFPEGTL